jgi:hypothetical protein
MYFILKGRLMPKQRLFFFAIAASLAMVSSCGIAEKMEVKKRLDASCLMAESILSIGPTYRNFPIVYSDHKSNPTAELAGWNLKKLVADWPQGRKPRIAMNLISGFANLPSSSAMVECPSLVELAKSKGSDFGDEAIRKATAASKVKGNDTYFSAQIISFSLPYMSENGRDALFLYNMTVAGLDGSGLLVLARKNSIGQWEINDTIQFWVS